MADLLVNEPPAPAPGGIAPNIRAPRPETIPLPNFGKPPKKGTKESVKIVEDGLPIVQTLTNAEGGRTLNRVPVTERYSDHALMVFKNEQIATFNIAYQTKEPAEGQTHFGHKFIMNETNPVFESDDDYAKRLETIAALVADVVEERELKAIVFQEVSKPDLLIEKLTEKLPAKFKYTEDGQVLAFNSEVYGPKVELKRLSLPPGSLKDTSGFNPRSTMENLIQGRVRCFESKQTKEFICSVHIPGLDLDDAEKVKARRKNVLEILNVIIQTLKQGATKGYKLSILGDFNVPLVVKGDPTIYSMMTYPIEIHTTLGNEGWSYKNHAGTQTDENIDQLIVVPRTDAKPPGRKARFANEEGRPLTATRVINENGSIDSLNTAARAEDEEEEEESLEAVAANTSLPTILRIGNGGKFDEFINVAEKTFTSLGGFQILHKGGQKELQRLYSVRDGDRLVAMQKAFGVRRLTDKPPLMTVLEKACTPEFDLNAVDQALESRISTLEAELGGLKETTQKGMKRAFLKVLQDLLNDMRELPEDNPCPPSTPSGGPGAGPGTGSGSGAGSTGCPCLDDLDLLRDLVMLVVTLMGIASPQVKAQLEEVRLDDILGLLDSGNSETATVRLREILQTLGDLEVATGGEAGGETIQDILGQLWNEFSEQPVPDPLTVPVLIQEIQGLIDNVSNNLRASQEELLDLRIEIAEKEEEVAALERQLSEVEGGRAPLVRELTAERVRLRQKDAEIARIQSELEERNRFIERARANEQDYRASKAAELTNLQSRLTAAEAARTAAQQSVTRLEGELAASRAETGAATAERIAAVAEKNALEAKVKGAVRKLIDVTTELQKVKAEKAALEQRLTAGDATVQGELTEKNRQITDLTRQVQECNEAKAALEAQLAQKNTEIAALTARAEGAEEESTAEKAKVTAAAGQVAALEEQLASVRAKLARLEERYTELIAATEARIAEYTRLTAETAAVEPSLRAEIDALKTSGAAAEQRATEAEAKATRLEAELTSAQEGLARATQEHAAAKAAAETQKQDLTTKLTELEGRIRATEEAADAITSQDSAKDDELAQLRADKTSLQAQLNALTAKGSEQETALAAAKAEFERQIATCKDALANLGTEKNSQLAAKNAELAAQKEAHEKAIAGLQAQIAAAEAKASKAETNAQGEIAKAQRAAAENRNAKVSAAENKAKAAEESAAQELGRFTTESAAKKAEIEDLKQKLAAAEAAKDACEEELAKKKAELDEIGASLPQPGEIEAQAAAKAAEMRKQEAEKETAAAKIAELETKISTLETTITGLQASPSEETEGKLNTLLSVILVDDDLKKAAQKFMTKEGTEANLEQLKAKKTDTGILSPELCDFYTYLYGLISLQFKKLPKLLQPDILQKFKNPPADGTKKQLLKEIALLFQAFFIMGETNAAPTDLILSEDTPVLHEFLSTLQEQPLLDTIQRNVFAREILAIGFLSQLALVPLEGSQKVKLVPVGKDFIRTFVEENTTHTLPLPVLAVKLIQLLHTDLNEKVYDIRVKCGSNAAFEREVAAPVSAPAPAAEEQKGGSEELSNIEFEEFTL